MKLLEKFTAFGEKEYTHKRLGLDRVRELLGRMDHPEKTYPSVLIAGTNGKGSVGRMLEAVLVEAGYPVGLFSSPHLVRFTERIRIGGEEVPAGVLEEILQDLQDRGFLDEEGDLKTSSGESLTWFEKFTVLALETFRRRKIPLALLEVGLGGRWDATNVVDPVVSLITSVGFDHTEVLGNSLFEIAREKVEVMRKGRPIILGPMDPNVRTFLMKASRMGEAKPVLPEPAKGTPENFSYGPFEGLSLGLQGDFQLGNVAVTIETVVALKETGFDIQNRHLRQGLARVKFPGRLELIPGKPSILLDVAHNAQALESLVHHLKQNYPEKKISLVLGMVQGKDPLGAIKQFTPFSPSFYFTEIALPRTLPLARWKELCEVHKLSGQFFFKSRDALQAATQDEDSDHLVVVTGSLYLVGELRDGFVRGEFAKNQG